MKEDLISTEGLSLNLATSLVDAANYIKSLSLESLDTEILLLSCLLINSLSQKDIAEANALAEYLTITLSPKQYIFFRPTSTSGLSDTALSKDRWGLDPNLIKTEH